MQNVSEKCDTTVVYPDQKRNSFKKLLLEANHSSNGKEWDNLDKVPTNKMYISNRPMYKDTLISSSPRAKSSKDQTKRARANGSNTNEGSQKTKVSEENDSSSYNIVVELPAIDDTTSSSTMGNKTFEPSSSDGESFNATEYKGERTYF